MSPRARDVKERISKWDYIKFKSFYMAKENISKMKKGTSSKDGGIGRFTVPPHTTKRRTTRN